MSATTTAATSMTEASFFQDELKKAGFTIFRPPMLDLGFFEWNPRLPMTPTAVPATTTEDQSPELRRQQLNSKRHEMNYLHLATLQSAKEITKYINVDGVPNDLIIRPQTQATTAKSTSGIATSSGSPLPLPFRKNIPHYEIRNQFPYGETMAAALYVATQHRGLDLPNDDRFDFMCGGSFLEFLAHNRTDPELQRQEPFFVTHLPPPPTSESDSTDGGSRRRRGSRGGGIILIGKYKRYTRDLNAPGFQFERMVSRPALDPSLDEDDIFDEPPPSVSVTEHLRTMKIGPFTVLFQAQVDARIPSDPLAEGHAERSGGELVEITASSNLGYWASQKAFQMIASGSSYMCHGQKSQDGAWLVDIQMHSLSEVVQKAQAHHRWCETALAERRILQGFKAIHEQMRGNDPALGQVYQISFFATGHLILVPMYSQAALSSSSRLMQRPHMPLPPTHVLEELLGYHKNSS